MLERVILLFSFIILTPLLIKTYKITKSDVSYGAKMLGNILILFSIIFLLSFTVFVIK